MDGVVQLSIIFASVLLCTDGALGKKDSNTFEVKDGHIEDLHTKVLMNTKTRKLLLFCS